MTTRWTWHPVKPGDKYAITPRADGVPMPYTVTKIVIWGRIFFEAWHIAESHHHRIGSHDSADDARTACIGHYRRQK